MMVILMMEKVRLHDLQTQFPSHWTTGHLDEQAEYGWNWTVAAAKHHVHCTLHNVKLKRASVDVHVFELKGI